MNNLKEKYQKEIIPKMKKKFGLKNDLAVPKIEKIIINIGIGKELQQNPKFIDIVLKDLIKIAGQKPQTILARKAISGFKLKENMPIGVRVTLRGQRMYDFLEKLINVTLPRTKDFRGIKLKAVDKNGNLNIGILEHTAFPEIKHEEITKPFSLQVNIVTITSDRKKALESFKLLGVVFER